MTTKEKSLYEDINSMINVSYLTYGLTTLNRNRDLIGADNLKDPDFLKNLPKTSTEVLKWFEDNYECAKSHFSSEIEAKLDLQYLQNISENDAQDVVSGEACLRVLDDAFAFEGRKSEAVYAITTNPDLRRITIIFRGSINSKDFQQDAKFKSEKLELSAKVLGKVIPNPSQKFLNAFDKVKIHRGFFEYIFQMKQQMDNKTKFEEIMEEVTGLLRQPEYEGYTVYVTGHSLGGALALLTAAGFAISQDVKNTVKLITFGMPQVGKSEFAKAFATLEKDHMIQHIRVTNNNDPVPQPFAFLGYKHTGVHLNLFHPQCCSKSTYSLKKSERGCLPIKNNDMSCSFAWITDPWHCHRLKESAERFELAKADFEGMTIDSVYEKVMGISRGNKD